MLKSGLHSYNMHLCLCLALSADDGINKIGVKFDLFTCMKLHSKNCYVYEIVLKLETTSENYRPSSLD